MRIQRATVEHAFGTLKAWMGARSSRRRPDCDLCENSMSFCSHTWLSCAGDFAGNILADQSITLDTGATLCGRAIALVGAVTMDGNTVSNNCGAADFGSYGFSRRRRP